MLFAYFFINAPCSIKVKRLEEKLVMSRNIAPGEALHFVSKRVVPLPFS
jgi:hypothetical protein